MIPRVKGTQDFLDMRLFNFIIDTIKKHFQQYHFSEIQTPILEHLDLFSRSLGEYTDVVSKEMFLIESRDAAGKDERICLRPEATAATVRAFNEHHIQQIPWKVFTFGPMFRYERPQKGRYRQFHQISIEIIGSAAISQDVHFIKMLDRFFHEALKLNNYSILINFLGCLEDRKVYIALLNDFLEGPQGQLICEQCKQRKERNIMRIFDCKSPDCQDIYKQVPFIVESLCEPCVQEWQTLQEQLEILSVSYVYRPTLVRGLDYYNKTVFEFVSHNLGAQDAFCGGGRYNQLVEQLGAKEDYPSIGAAIGLERLMMLLEPIINQLMMPELPALQVIVPLSEDQNGLALLLADTLQAHNLCVDILFDGSLKSRMRKADKMGARFVVVIGSDEQEAKTVVLKNMVTGQENKIAQVGLVDFLKGI